jgi:predicted PurR-regulated permease PerM
VIGGLLVVVTAINAVILSGMLSTLFFAITVVYVLEPLFDRLRRRGLSRWTAGAIATATAGVAGLALFVPLAAAVYLRRAHIRGVLESIPPELVFRIEGTTYAVEIQQYVDPATRLFSQLVIDTALSLPIIAAKAVVFALVVFAILTRREELATALLAPVPEAYAGIAADLDERVRRTLLALYVTQAATAFGTFLISLPVFFLFGYESFLLLSVAAGLLQFLPVIGPSVVILALAAIEVTQGRLPTAALLSVVGLALIGFLPDALIRPQIAQRTADLPASLYFVGFTGGILSLGAIGIIAGPVAVALLDETVTLLGEEVSADSTTVREKRNG